MVFKFKALRKKAQHFRTKLPCQKPMLRQMEWGVQNKPKNECKFLELYHKERVFSTNYFTFLKT